MGNFADRLTTRMTERATRVVVGLDPDLERIRQIPALASCGVEEALLGFCGAVLEACAPYACAVKPQIAFFECWGVEGWSALQQVCRQARGLSVPVILDAKRGDIGSTCTAYARLLAPDGPLGGVDAVTVNPYLGADSIDPFLAVCREHGTGLFVLAKTSNPSASDLQDLRLADGRRVCEAVSDLVVRWGDGLVGECGRSSIGAVVGATQYDDLALLRGRMPRAIWLLPGVGAQGADTAKLRCAFGEDTLGACVSSSRGVLYAWEKDAPDQPGTFAECAGSAAERLRAEVVVASSSRSSQPLTARLPAPTPRQMSWHHDTYGDFVESGNRRLADAWELLEMPTWEPTAARADTRHLAGAYYLAGYAVECALKSYIICMEDTRLSLSQVIAKSEQGERLARDPHNLSRLLAATDLGGELATQADLQRCWGTVSGRWRTDLRYQRKLRPSRGEARKWVTAVDKLHRWIDSRRSAREGQVQWLSR